MKQKRKRREQSDRNWSSVNVLNAVTYLKPRSVTSKDTGRDRPTVQTKSHRQITSIWSKSAFCGQNNRDAGQMLSEIWIPKLGPV